MNPKFKKTLFTAIPIALGVGLIWYFVAQLSPQDKKDILTSFKTANYWWIVVSLFCGILSHLSRAYRWQFMLEPLGFKPTFPNTVMTVLIAYLVNLGIPRGGEIARATAINKYEKIPFDKAFGTIVAERIADVIMLLTIMATAFILQTELISQYIFKEDSNPYKKFAILGGLAIAAFAFYYFIIKKSQYPFIVKIRTFINGLIEGVMSIFKMKKKWAFIFHTIFIWVMYVAMFYFATLSIPETSNLPFAAIIVGFVVGGIAIALTNGGLGSFPLFVASALTLYGVADNPAKAFGWIMWTAQTLMIIVFGGLSFLFLPIYNRNRS